MKKFKTESKKLMDMMINSIYTHKEIFLRELISNASDAIDKLYFKSLTDSSVTLTRDDYEIRLEIDKENRMLTITDNGIGMTAEELENNLGTIAKSGSSAFKAENGESENASQIDVIGQFGVGFYSAFMVADRVSVISKAFGSDEANIWQSSGAEGYTIDAWEKEEAGTVISLHIKPSTEEEDYERYLDEYELSSIVKKYSDYIRYPIRMLTEKQQKKEDSDEYETVSEDKTLNSMTPLWKKQKSEVTDEEYNEFYKNNFYDFGDPLKVIHSKTEGNATYSALLYIPAHAPFDYYNSSYKRGLKLFSKGVLISECCEELLPEYYGFVKGLVDSEDLSLNISREMLQHDHQLRLIARTIERKIKSELKKMMANDRENYEKLFAAFGTQFKYGVYNDYGAHKDELKDLLMFKSSAEGKFVSLDEYIGRMKEGQEAIYYASGETVEKIDMLPQVDAVKDKGYELLYLTDVVDEFAIKMLIDYEGKRFCNVCAENTGLESDEDKENIKNENESAKELFDIMKEALPDVSDVRFTNKLKNHPVCLTSEGEISVEMEKILAQMPNNQGVKATVILEINNDHEIATKLRGLKAIGDDDTIKDYAKLLYGQARLIEGLTIDNPVEFSDLICKLMK